MSDPDINEMVRQHNSNPRGKLARILLAFVLLFLIIASIAIHDLITSTPVPGPVTLVTPVPTLSSTAEVTASPTNAVRLSPTPTATSIVIQKSSSINTCTKLKPTLSANAVLNKIDSLTKIPMAQSYTDTIIAVGQKVSINGEDFNYQTVDVVSNSDSKQRVMNYNIWILNGFYIVIHNTTDAFISQDLTFALAQVKFPVLNIASSIHLDCLKNVQWQSDYEVYI